MDDFLIDRDPQTWSVSSAHPSSLVPLHLFVQPTPGGLEIAVAKASHKPRVSDLRSAWVARRQKRTTPVLLIAFYPSAEALSGYKVALCGPVGSQPVVHLGVEVSQAERLAEVALREPSHHAATRLLLAALGEIDSPVAGLRNSGLLATQELIAGVPMRTDWVSANTASGHLLAHRGRQLIESLGYNIATLATNASVLTVAGRREAIAVFCDDSEPFDTPSDRFDGMSPASRALALADRHNVDWVLLTRAAEIRLYCARVGVGVGRKGRAETFVELNLSLLAAERAGYLTLLFAADAISTDGSLHQILHSSEEFAAALAIRLRERIYHQTVPALARAIAARLSRDRPADTSSRSIRTKISETDLDDAFEQVMVILFRLLFVAYAEDKDLLPYRSNGRYADHSLTRLAQRLATAQRSGAVVFDDRATDLWDDAVAVWDAVSSGNGDWGVPAYNGGLFSDDPAVSPTGAAIAALRLTNAEFGPAVAAALVDDSPEGPGPVDFRSLSVREFGTIYEGLLESKLSVAADDLTVKQVKGTDQYVPAGAGDQTAVAAGEVYFHNRSGARKATGSYFTKPFAVDHLLDHALTPALDDHLGRLDALRDAGDDAGVAAAFFDFRCADIAMGSGHFLVAAVDRIEARLSAWLSLHPVPAITAELNRLREVAVSHLGDLSDGAELETSSLLRRQIARHCVYGVDKNRVAVELARLAIWCHTFVAGLPLSFLDHNFVHGDSLTGTGTLEEVVVAFDPDAASPGLFHGQIVGLLENARSALRRLARTSDASKHEIDEARSAHAEAQDAVAGARAIFDVVTANRAGLCNMPENFDPAVFQRLAAEPLIASEIAKLQPVHFPAAFPEVFLQDNPGFDCMIGNPPWEQVVVQENVWWGMHLPRIRALPINKMNAEIKKFRALRPDLEAEFQISLERAEQMRNLLRNKFQEMGSGRTDLYQAFSWANLSLTAAGGHLGLVLPYTATQASGMTNWRREVVGDSAAINGGGGEGQTRRVTISALINHKGWVFDEVHNSYTVVLATLTRTSPSLHASTPDNGRSTMSTVATPSHSSPLAGTTRDTSLGGGFDTVTHNANNQPAFEAESATVESQPLGDRPEASFDEAHVAVYPGPAQSLAHFRELVDGKPELIPTKEFTSWSESVAFPLLPSRAAFTVWRKMNSHPTLGAGSREQGAGSREQGAGSREQGAGSREQGAGSREQGAGSREQGAGSREQGAGSREQGAGSREQGAGSREQGAGSREQGAGSREQGAGSREQGAGSREPTTVAGQALARRPQRDQRQTSPPARRWRSRPHRELDATNDKHLFILDAGVSARSQNSTQQPTSIDSSSTRDEQQ